MNIPQLKSLGLPVLQAQLKVHNVLLDRIFTVARTQKVAASLYIVIQPENNGMEKETFHFPSPDHIPPELQKFFNDYSTRLIGERTLMIEAVEELQFELQQAAN